jgi:hypothetical protein
LWKFLEGDTMDDIMADFRTFADMLKNANRKTYAITDLLDFDSIPRNGMSYYPEMAKLSPKGEARAEIIAIVTQRMLVNMSTEIFSRIYPDFKDRFFSFPTVQQALDFINERIRESAA